MWKKRLSEALEPGRVAAEFEAFGVKLKEGMEKNKSAKPVLPETVVSPETLGLKRSLGLGWPGGIL